VKSHRSRARLGASVAAGLSAALAFTSLVATPAFAAPAAPAAESTEVSVDDAVFAWSLNKETGNRSYSGAYNFLSAGAIAKTDASDTITESEWLASDGNVTIQKPDADGAYTTATWAGTKTDPTGATITSPTGGTSTGNRVSISGGTGYYDPATDSAEIQWNGDFTVAYYGGLTQFTVSDPFLTVTAGYGVVLGTLSGYGTSMEDSSAFTELPAKEAQIVTFNAPVDVTADGIVIAPDYAGVQLTLPEGATAQSTTSANWGAFPQEFVDYQFGTGQSSYWYSSGGAADAGKVAQPITIAFPESDPDPGTGEPGTGEPGAGETVVDGAQLEWAYSRYAQYGVFGAWSMKASGADVSTGTANGKDISGLDADAAKSFNLVRFDDGEGSLDAETGAGTITWADTGDWVLNAYNGQYGAPDETLRDPILTINDDGTGDLSFEAYIPAGLDMSGNQAPAAGPTRIAIATFSSVSVENGVITALPDYAGRSYTPAAGSPWAACDGAGGSWPTAWIDFLPSSVQAHYYTTSCSGLNLMKPPVAFTVALESTDATITAQPAGTTVDAGTTASFSVSASGNPLGYQWQKSTDDGATWADVEGATNSVLSFTAAAGDDGSEYRVSINGSLISDATTLTVNSAAPVLSFSGNDLVVYAGSPGARFSAYAGGIPAPTQKWQTSTDDGATWADVESTGPEYALSNPQAADSGLLARAVFDNGVGTVTSDPKKLTVVDFQGPSTMWVQNTTLTLDAIEQGETDTRVSFAGFTVPAGSTTNITAALVPESALEGTNTPDLASALWTGTLWASNLEQTGGHQVGQLVQAWGGPIDPSIRYYLVTFSEDLTDRSYDSRLLLPIEGQEPDATPITSATVEFGFNAVHQGASPAGGCNYFVAGAGQGLGSDYTSVDGNVYVIKKHNDGTSQVVDVTSRCTPAEGSSSSIDQRFLFTKGEGQTDADGTTIQWTGAGTVNAYGGLVSWYFENPELKLDTNGDGQITARVGGFGSSMADPTIKVPLDPREGVVIAEVKGATIEGGRITIDPVWKNVDYFPLADAQDPTSTRSTTSAVPQAAKDTNPDWGSWPESFVDFQYATGLSSYWHTSGLSADPLKPPLPITVALEGSAPVYDVLLTQQPVGVDLSEGDDATFTGGATAASGAVTFQWQAKKAGSEEWVDIEGATDAQLTLTGVTVADWNGAAVRFVATSSVNSATSGEASLVVTAPTAPVYAQQPVDYAALLDQGAYFNVGVTGYPDPTVTWEKQTPGGEWETSNDSSSSYSDGGVIYSYVSPDAKLEASGTKFRAVATNSSGSTVSDEVTLTVSTKAAGIVQQPRDMAMFEGGTAYIYVGVEGAPYPTTTWEKSIDGGATWAATELEGDYISFTATPDIDGVLYRATVSNEFATVVSGSASIQVLDPAAEGLVHVGPTTIDPSVDTTIDWVLGDQPDIPGNAQGVFTAGVIETTAWQPGDAPVDRTAFVEGLTSQFGPGDWSYFASSTTIAAGTLDPEKSYGFAWLWSPYEGQTAYPAFDTFIPLTVEVPAPVPAVTVSKTEGLDPNGETITVTGSGFLPHAPETDGAGRPLSGFGGAYVVFGKFADTWQPSAGAASSARSGIDTRWGVLAADVETIGGATRGAIEIEPDGTFETTLTVKSGAFDKEGTYGVYTYAGGGAVYAPFETATPVTLNEAGPAVTAQPSGIAVPATPAAGDPVALFTVGVSGAPAPTVQWQKKAADGDWADVAGASSTTLALPYAAGDDGVSVRAVVTNGLGSVTSDTAVLTVTPDPVDPVDPVEPVEPVEPSAPLTPLTDDELAAAPQGTVSILGIDGDVVTISVGVEHAGEFVGTEVHSTPAFLGWSAVSSAGTTTTTLPADLPAGEHHLVVRAADGSVIGWAVFTVADETVVTPIDPGENLPDGGSGSGPATGSGAGAVALSNTGFEATGWLAGALLLLVAGAGVLVARRVRRS
jgi:hypothetical protein